MKLLCVLLHRHFVIRKLAITVYFFKHIYTLLTVKIVNVFAELLNSLHLLPFLFLGLTESKRPTLGLGPRLFYKLGSVCFKLFSLGLLCEFFNAYGLFSLLLDSVLTF